MLRALDLSVYENEINEYLNNPELRLVTLKISCSEETAYTVASLRFQPCERRETRYCRYLKRFVTNMGFHLEVDQLLANQNIRLLHQHVFPTAEGTVIVLDYQVKKEGRSEIDGAI